ncbi:MAG: putative Se/S carrier-like protein [Lachnospirales bacterium]
MYNIIITFLSHYDAVSFLSENRKSYDSIKIAPVPRQISSSCGSCIMLKGNSSIIDIANIESSECLYEIKDGKYVKVAEND